MALTNKQKAALEAALIARAEAEHRAWLEAGIYEGDYPGATMPMTEAYAPVGDSWQDIIRPI